jgi:hypothetical protein
MYLAFPSPLRHTWSPLESRLVDVIREIIHVYSEEQNTKYNPRIIRRIVKYYNRRCRFQTERYIKLCERRQLLCDIIKNN